MQEGTQIKSLRSPSAPSRQEMLEHSLTHFPFRNWCPHCVMGKAKASKHSVTGGTEESAVPIVGFDYAFMSDRVKPEDVEGHGDELEDDAEAAAGAEVIKVLVGHDSRSKACAAIPVPQKGLDPEEYSVREALKYIDFLGYQSLIVKTDQEASLDYLVKDIVQEREESEK